MGKKAGILERFDWLWVLGIPAFSEVLIGCGTTGSGRDMATLPGAQSKRKKKLEFFGKVYFNWLVLGTLFFNWLMQQKKLEFFVTAIRGGFSWCFWEKQKKCTDRLVAVAQVQMLVVLCCGREQLLARAELQGNIMCVRAVFFFCAF